MEQSLTRDRPERAVPAPQPSSSSSNTIADVPKLAKVAFWLDGGYDRASVEACPRHPRHEWWTFRLGDVLESPAVPSELMTICKACYVPRCGVVADGENRCIHPRHHPQEFHRSAKGILL